MDVQQRAAPKACTPMIPRFAAWLHAASDSLTSSALFIVMIVMGVGTPVSAQAVSSYYTNAQASAGKIVFGRQCALCHGQNLQGKVGPALAGQQFLSVSEYQQLTADYLYRFMAKQMPANAPGSLSKSQYLDLLAYILKVNGYPAGSSQLTADDRKLAEIKIAPNGKTASGIDKTEEPQ